jgi:hypothetical protein
MANTRPYFIDFKGEHFMVEAASPAAAVKQVVGSDIREIRPARGSEVLAWSRADKQIIIAGAKTVATTASEPEAREQLAVEASQFLDEKAVDPAFTIRDVIVLIEAKSDYDPAALAAINKVKSEDRLTLEHFDIIRTAWPDFGWMLCDVRVDQPVSTADIDEVRARLEDSPMPAQIVADTVWARQQLMAEGSTKVATSEEVSALLDDPAVAGSVNVEGGGRAA